MFKKVDPQADFIKLEHSVLDFWEKNDIFKKRVALNKGKPPWSFIDGPITANNPMGVHHAWGRTLKDVFQRYHAMQGYDLRYQNGFDCQGLWVDLDSFLYAAQVCDTQSDVTVQLDDTPSTAPAAGAVYEYRHDTGGFKWRGTVSSYNTATKKVTFTDCIGKLTHRFNDWRSRDVGDVIYSADESELERCTRRCLQS